MNGNVPVENCTGCAACSVRCPRGAISMAESSEGFLYPFVDKGRCDSCALCLSICPVAAPRAAAEGESTTLFAGWSTDGEVLRQSSSGGVFSELAASVIGAGGIVFGAAFDEGMKLRHVGVQSLEGLGALRGSKYVQSDAAASYREAQEALDAGKAVLFCGTPCQVAGLRAVLPRHYQNLVTCDLICHGVPSPKVLRKAVEDLQRSQRSRVVAISFRDKSFGWLHPTVVTLLESGRSLRQAPRDNPYLHGFYQNIDLRRVCYDCPFKSTAPVADLTLGDFWQLQKYRPSLINRKGTSAVLVHTRHGRERLDSCGARLVLAPCPLSFIEHDSMWRVSPHRSPQRDPFFADLDRLSFRELTRKYLKPRGIAVRQLALFSRTLRGWLERLE